MTFRLSIWWLFTVLVFVMTVALLATPVTVS